MVYSSAILLQSLVAAASLIASGQTHSLPRRDCEGGIGGPVNTTSGLVHGHSAPNATEVTEYLGIPFAKPPIGALRFEPPVRYYGSGNLSGAKFGPICPQMGGSFADLSSISNSSNVTAIPQNAVNLLSSLAATGQLRSEDCLTVNVWTKPQEESKKKPVMVWIYGGGFGEGEGSVPAYSGQYWANEEDVVFVNFNYRLGVIGFSGAPTLAQNVGLLDQRLAVEWVRDNAEAFGGDPSRIILFGESAGAASADYYTYIWTEDPIVSGTIHESGQANAFGNKNPVSQAQAWYTLTTAVGCGNTTTQTAEQVVACMKDSSKVSSDDLITKSIGAGPLSVILANFGPTIDNKTVFSNYTQLDLEGKFIKKPALVGNNDNEAGIFILIFGFFGITQPQSAWDALTKQIFTCPSNTAAYARKLHHVPIWRYRYFPSFPNINLPTSVNRAYHLSEVFPLFGTDVDVSGEKSTRVERKLGRYMRNAWAAFAHNPVHGLGKGPFHWPQYSADVNGTDGLVLLGRNNNTGAEFSPRGKYDGDCPLLYQGL